MSMDGSQTCSLQLAKSWCQCRGRFKRCQLSRILFPPPNIVTNPVTFLYLIDLVRRQIVQALGQALGQRTSTESTLVSLPRPTCTRMSLLET